jgi:hypothetical protein
MRNETGERRELEALKATTEKWGEGRRNRRVTEKKGGVVQLISPPGKKILGIATVAAKKRPQRLKGKKRKSPTRGPKTNSEKVPKNMTICKKAHVRPIHSSKLEE